MTGTSNNNPTRRTALATLAGASVVTPYLWTRSASAAQQLVVRTPGGVFDDVKRRRDLTIAGEPDWPTESPRLTLIDIFPVLAALSSPQLVRPRRHERDIVPRIFTGQGVRYAAGYCGSGMVWARCAGEKAAKQILGDPWGCRRRKPTITRSRLAAAWVSRRPLPSFSPRCSGAGSAAEAGGLMMSRPAQDSQASNIADGPTRFSPSRFARGGSVSDHAAEMT